MATYKAILIILLNVSCRFSAEVYSPVKQCSEIVKMAKDSILIVEQYHIKPATSISIPKTPDVSKVLINDSSGS
jgi:hypothetical protein